MNDFESWLSSQHESLRLVRGLLRTGWEAGAAAERNRQHVPPAKPLIELTCEEYANTMHPGWGGFRQRRDGFYLYNSPSFRFRVELEQHSEPGFGYDRREAFVDELINVDDVDAQEFAAQFVERFCEHLTLHELNVLIPVLTKYRNDWEARRQAVIQGDK